VGRSRGRVGLASAQAARRQGGQKGLSHHLSRIPAEGLVNIGGNKHGM
jgi:hypothetical protein